MAHKFYHIQAILKFIEGSLDGSLGYTSALGSDHDPDPRIKSGIRLPAGSLLLLLYLGLPLCVPHE